VGVGDEEWSECGGGGGHCIGKIPRPAPVSITFFFFQVNPIFGHGE